MKRNALPYQVSGNKCDEGEAALSYPDAQGPAYNNKSKKCAGPVQAVTAAVSSVHT